jgi:1,4-dihydroxy-2-naphthoyl-CoA hydrolase
MTEPLIDREKTALMHGAMPYTATLGIHVTHAGPDEVRSRLAWAESLTTTGGMLHGGVLMSLADANGGLCAFLNLPTGAATSTIESKTNFLRAVRGGFATAVSRPLHVGRRVIVVETDVLDDDDRLVARATQSQTVLADAPGQGSPSTPPAGR